MKTQVDINKNIADTMRETYARRRNQTCVTIKCKVERKSLRKDQLLTLKQMFLEAKWVYNYALGNNMIYGYSYKDFMSITRRLSDGNDIPVNITHIKAGTIDKIISRMQDSIKSLSKLKDNGHKVGSLRFKSEYQSIIFKQYGVTHYIKGNRIKLQGVKRPIRVNGLKQIDRLVNPEITTFDLIFDGYDYWVNISCYVDKSYLHREIKTTNIDKKEIIGIDFGIVDNITLSNGKKYNISINKTERLSKLEEKQNRQIKHSNNWYKTKALKDKEWAKIKRRRKELSNKLVHIIFSSGKTIITQDDNFSNWKDNKSHSVSAKIIQISALGTIKTKMKQHPNCYMLEKYYPTTKLCTECGYMHENLSVSDRTFVCPNCGHTEDRDTHAANNMIFFYQQYKDTVGTTDTSKPDAYVSIKYKKPFMSKILSKLQNRKVLGL